MRRFWTIADLAELEAYYADHTGAECAGRFRRTLKAIYQAVATYGFNKQSRVVVDRKFSAAIRRLNREGLSDTETADRLQCERHTVSIHRRALGLPSNARGERFRDRVRANTRRQCAAMGVDSLGEIRALTFRVRALKAGWPVDLRPRHVQILDLLGSRGPMTRREIADAIGLPWRGSRRSLKSGDPEGSYLAHLMNRGMVVQLGRLAKGVGRGHSVHLYAMAITTERKAKA